jgi:molybdate transport repressor ModE-like protein
MNARGIDWDSRIRRQLKLRDLHILEEVVKHGSMAKAAPHVGVSQPAVSQAIGELEAMLGVRLLDRGPGGVMPTLFGEALLKRGNEVFDALKQSIRDIEFLAEPGVGEITIGTSESYISGGYLAAAIASRRSNTRD